MMRIISEIRLNFSTKSLTTHVGMVKRGVSVGRLLRGE